MADTIEAEEREMVEDITSFLAGYSKERRHLIPLLQTIQQRHKYLSEDAIRLVAGHLELSPCEVYGVATFYNQFRFNPPGRNQIKVCLGTACHVKGGDIILENFERKLGIKDGETTLDREFSIERVACVGCCALAPVALVNETVHGHVAPSKVEGLVLGFQLAKEKAERERRKEASGERQGTD
ncbi:NADH-quinone oxidoreductase subunit NuoE [Desulfatiglans anilini]|uniref:NADH-quinone oxidoreductase subunit NuoE n=1 Tax=Desulfatiglans anilini TaxID=90728 RepID=UPI0004102EB1|nr:NADH-quinone oxidoreductase subunit NuoE [Desulfatiglans anilini]